MSFFLCSSLCQAAEKPPAGLLDKKVFVGAIGEKGKAKGETDTIEFDLGRFRSRACDPYGFEDAPYTASEQDGIISFKADTASPTDGTMQWQGTIQGGQLTATAFWAQPDGQPPKEYWVKARLK